MSHYRGYFMKDDHIVAPENIEAADDAQAMLKAGELLSTSQFVRIEVWQETRVVGAVSAPAPPDAAKLDKDDSHSYGDGKGGICYLVKIEPETLLLPPFQVRYSRG